MAYTKTAWVDDDGSSTVGTLVTAARMNKIEQGVFDASLDAAPFVTVLPVAPVDGQEVSFVADATAGIVWHLKYRAADPSAYKWQYIGGPVLASEANAGAGHTTSATAFTTTTFADISITLPLAGDYQMDFTTVVNNFIASVGDFRIVPLVAGVSPMGVGIANYCNATWYQQFNGRALAFGKAKNALAQLGFLSAATSVTFQSSERHLFVTPVRVG
jgi:hypothetical protein